MQALYLGWKIMSFPCQKGQKDLLQFMVKCEDLPPYMLGSLMLVPTHLAKKTSWHKNQVTALCEKGILNFERSFSTLPVTYIAYPLGTGEKKKSASSEIFLRKLLSLNIKYFVMEKFDLWPIKQSIFCISNYWVLVRCMGEWKTGKDFLCFPDPFSTS